MSSKIAIVNTPQRYLVTKIKYPWRLNAQCLPVRISVDGFIDQDHHRSMMILEAFRFRLEHSDEQARKFSRY